MPSKLSAQNFSKEVSQLHLEKISLYSIDWRRLPPYLGLQSFVVTDVDGKQIDENEKRKEFLQKWKLIKGADATYEKLVYALLKVGHINNIVDVCRLMWDSTSESGKLTGAWVICS